MEIISSEPQMENFKISLPLKGLEEKNIEIQAKIKGQGGEGKKIIAAYFAQEKELSLATARDILKTTRKYALPLIEYYDRIRFTRRVGDMRVKL